ncbi:MAG: SRPBCC family protein [Phycisphaeraceae bacterium]|nr:SRPBCC family protein [Phycisphaeraceae bacterium]
MKQITLRGSWVIRAPRDSVYAIMSDFERMPQRFPKVAHSLQIIAQAGNTLRIAAEAKSFGTVIPVAMTTVLHPPKGYISDNVNEKLGTFGHEEFLMEEIPEGTRINYTYAVTIRNWWLGVVATPLLKWYALRFWKRAVIDTLKNMLEPPQR